MAGKVDLEIAGVIENMAGFVTPGGERFAIFGEGGGQELADELDVPLLGKVPLTMPLREQADAGEPLVFTDPDDPAAQSIRQAARGLLALFPVELPILSARHRGRSPAPVGMSLPMAEPRPAAPQPVRPEPPDGLKSRRPGRGRTVERRLGLPMDAEVLQPQRTAGRRRSRGPRQRGQRCDGLLASDNALVDLLREMERERAHAAGAARSVVRALAVTLQARDGYTGDHADQVHDLSMTVGAPPRPRAPRAGRARRGRAAARRRQDRDPGRGPAQARPARRRRVGADAHAPDRSASASCPPCPGSRTSRAPCATSTSAGTAAAIPTGCAARRSRWPRGSCWPATPGTRWSATAPTASALDARGRARGAAALLRHAVRPGGGRRAARRRSPIPRGLAVVTSDPGALLAASGADSLDRELVALIAVASAVAGAHRLDDVLDVGAEAACTAIGAASLSIERWLPERSLLRTLINVGDLAPGEERRPGRRDLRARGRPASCRACSSAAERTSARSTIPTCRRSSATC